MFPGNRPIACSRLVAAIALVCLHVPPASGAPALEARPDEGARRVWHTANFRIDHDFALPEADVRRIATVAEGLRVAVAAHPMPWHHPPEGRAVISLFARPEGFKEAGGPEHAAGFYDHRNRRVLLRGIAMFREVRGGRLVALPTADALLIHELTHLHTHGVNGRMPQWFVEGVAEYFCAIHAGGGRFDANDIDTRIRQYLIARTLAKGPEIHASRLDDIATLRQPDWDDLLKPLDESLRYRPYATALLLVHFHLHGGEARRVWLRDALENANRPPPRRGRPTPTPALETDGIEDLLARYWRNRGLAVRFTATATPIP